MMKMVYICSPFRDDDKLKQYANTRAAQGHCRRAYEQNCIPVAPHLYLPQFLDDDTPAERDLALRIGLRLIDYCSEVWVHGDRISDGMCGEIEYATATGKPVIYKNGIPREKPAEPIKSNFETVSHAVDYEDVAALVEEGAAMELREDI